MIPLAEFHFLRPGWFLALIPALLLLIALWRRHSEGARGRESVMQSCCPTCYWMPVASHGGCRYCCWRQAGY